MDPNSSMSDFFQCIKLDEDIFILKKKVKFEFLEDIGTSLMAYLHWWRRTRVQTQTWIPNPMHTLNYTETFHIVCTRIHLRQCKWAIRMDSPEVKVTRSILYKTVFNSCYDFQLLSAVVAYVEVGGLIPVEMSAWQRDCSSLVTMPPQKNLSSTTWTTTQYRVWWLWKVRGHLYEKLKLISWTFAIAWTIAWMIRFFFQISFRRMGPIGTKCYH